MNEKLLRLLELINIYISQGVLIDEFQHFSGEEEPIETIDDLIQVMESEMSYWEPDVKEG